uniref:BolA-like protein n=1 Tax=Picea sitchensis TaxID=3332 RepID=A9NWD1_PICSI|nr:unknown [Picea sitchensis]
MAVTKEIMETTLTNKLQPIYLNVLDTSGGCGTSFAVEIVSSQFDGKRSLDRHRMVNSALAEELKRIHALSLKMTRTPQQWNEQQAQESRGATN